VPALGDVPRRRMCPRVGRKPVVGGAFCCTRITGRRRAQAVARADCSNDRRRRDRRESDPRHDAVARLSADQIGSHSRHFTRPQIARATSLVVALVLPRLATARPAQV